MTDDDLVARIRTGDEEACRQFDRQFRQRIQVIARKRGVPTQDCEDVAQNVLADAIRQIQQDRFRAAASLATWVHSMINGWIANYFRARGPEVIPIDEIGEDHQALMATGSPDASVAVNEALSRLNAEDRLLLLLHEQQRLTLEEISPLLGIRKSAIWDRLQIARKHFRAAIQDGGKTQPPRRLKD